MIIRLEMVVNEQDNQKKSKISFIATMMLFYDKSQNKKAVGQSVL